MKKITATLLLFAICFFSGCGFFFRNINYENYFFGPVVSEKIGDEFVSFLGELYEKRPSIILHSSQNDDSFFHAIEQKLKKKGFLVSKKRGERTLNFNVSKKNMGDSDLSVKFIGVSVGVSERGEACEVILSRLYAAEGREIFPV